MLYKMLHDTTLRKLSKLKRMNFGRSLVTMEINSLPQFEQGGGRPPCGPILRLIPAFQMQSDEVSALLLQAATMEEEKVVRDNNSNENNNNNISGGGEVAAAQNDEKNNSSSISVLASPFPTYTIAYCCALITRPQVSLFRNATAVMREAKKVHEELSMPFLSDKTLIIEEDESIIHAICMTIDCRLIVAEVKFNSLSVYGQECGSGDAAVIIARPVTNRRYCKYSLLLLGDDADKTKLPYDEALAFARHFLRLLLCNSDKEIEKCV